MNWGFKSNSKIPNSATDAYDLLSICLVAVGEPNCSEGLSANVRDGKRYLKKVGKWMDLSCLSRVRMDEEQPPTLCFAAWWPLRTAVSHRFFTPGVVVQE